ncbi:MAG: hypothetical protein IJW53_05085 [Clostridia bacterium]|nr:hypothetical protein [Clostridia bacterium]
MCDIHKIIVIKITVKPIRAHTRGVFLIPSDIKQKKAEGLEGSGAQKIKDRNRLSCIGHLVSCSVRDISAQIAPESAPTPQNHFAKKKTAAIVDAAVLSVLSMIFDNNNLHILCFGIKTGIKASAFLFEVGT